eukprot:COSAG01_NODE_29013_length_647_cov_1.669708_1_plen_202_part_01
MEANEHDRLDCTDPSASPMPEGWCLAKDVEVVAAGGHDACTGVVCNSLHMTGAECIQDHGGLGYTCPCEEGWVGSECDQMSCGPDATLQANACGPHATSCQPRRDARTGKEIGHICDCQVGYTGEQYCATAFVVSGATDSGSTPASEINGRYERLPDHWCGDARYAMQPYQHVGVANGAVLYMSCDDVCSGGWSIGPAERLR